MAIVWGPRSDGVLFGDRSDTTWLLYGDKVEMEYFGGTDLTLLCWDKAEMEYSLRTDLTLLCWDKAEMEYSLSTDLTLMAVV